jgi:hypothetical protein
MVSAPAGASVDKIFPTSGHVRTFPEAVVSRFAVPSILTESPEAKLQRLRQRE